MNYSVSNSIKSKHTSPSPLTDNTLNEKFKLSTEPSPSLFSKCITAISNTITSIYYAISGKTKIPVIENPIYQKGYASSFTGANSDDVLSIAKDVSSSESNKTGFTKIASNEAQLATKESLLSEFDYLLKDCPESDSLEINEFNQLIKDWKTIYTNLSTSQNSMSKDYQEALTLIAPDIKKHPIFLQKLIPIVCKILDTQESRDKIIDELASRIAPYTTSSATSDIEQYTQQYDSNLSYIKLMLINEYSQHQERMAKLPQTYAANKNAIEEDINLSSEQRIILNKINYLVANLMSDPQLLQTEGLLRKSSGALQALRLVNSINPKSLDVLTLKSNQQPPHRIISAIKKLREDFLTQSKSDRQKMSDQFNDFKEIGLTKSLAELDHITRICMPLYREIIRNEKVNKMSIGNVAQLEGELYQHAFSTDPIGNAWRAIATELVTAMINSDSLLAV